ncbi:MAG: hypothetical protein JO323_22380, partial [Acidobacteriia bacterium]|nr:hypothetical protein [Terriglobia bacterium]
MTTRTCSAKIIPDPWHRAGALLLLVALAVPGAHRTPVRPGSRPAVDLAALVRAYRESPSPAGRVTLAAYADAHAKDLNGSLARLALGVADYEQKDYANALEDLQDLGAKLPAIADYVAYYMGAARVEANDLAGVAQTLMPVRRGPWPSPLVGRAWLLEARALKPGQAAEAVRLLREHYAELPQPEGAVILADCYQAAGDLQHAAEFYQRVYYSRISGDAAARAAAALLTLKDSLGSQYPQPRPRLELERAGLLLDAREYVEARKAYQTLAAQLTGVDRDLARVGVGAVDFLSGNTAAAYPYLRSLEVAASEADAERLFYLEECARRLTDDDEMRAALERLDGAYPQSPWRLRALMGVGNRYLVANRPADYMPLYKAVYESFPAEPPAAPSHWRVAFQSYIENRDNAAALLREHLEKYPAHSTAGAALYFLGRDAEKNRQFPAASIFYTRLSKTFSNTSYAVLARERLNLPELKNAGASPETSEFLLSLALPQAKPVPVEPVAATSARVARSRLLRTAGLNDLADSELRFGART